MINQDERRKLGFNDYQRIHLQFDGGMTIRSLANEFGCSTKYIRKVLDRDLLEIASGKTLWDTPVDSWNPHRCSGCNRPFETTSLLESHYGAYLSGGATELVCMTMVAGR